MAVKICENITTVLQGLAYNEDEKIISLSEITFLGLGNNDLVMMFPKVI